MYSGFKFILVLKSQKDLHEIFAPIDKRIYGSSYSFIASVDKDALEHTFFTGLG